MDINLISKILFLILLNCFYIETLACTSGWFGLKCQYLCHCNTSTSCDVNGQCSTKCATGWFGLACQYQDLTTIPGATVNTLPTQTTTTWLTDRDDTTCNEDQNLQSLKISWNKLYPFTWLRVKVTDSNIKMDFAMTFKSTNGLLSNCKNQQIAVLDNATVDYRCEMNDTITELTVTGSGVKSLCSLYISGGRNVALRQTAAQTSTIISTLSTSTATLAVDGNIDNQYNHGSCSHTSNDDLTPSWTLTLETAKIVNRFIVYNRADCCRERLQYFKLELLDINNNTLWTYQDTNTNVLLIYTFTRMQKVPVSKIRIYPTTKLSSDSVFYLTLCELEIYGECVPGTWGLECNQTCHVECKTWCHQDTGTCLSCLGYNDPPQCNTACLPGKYGLNCQYNCSSCYTNTCDKTTGSCSNGCNGHSNPPQCTIPCIEGKFGLNCQSNCDNRCFNNTCDKTTGLCDKGCIGYNDFPYCTTQCPKSQWGRNCDNKCSTNCYDKSCDITSGVCDKGCSGYINPPECTQECPDVKWGPNCQFNCRSNCYNSSCDKMTGVCDKGCSGFMDPPDCTVECKTGKWGLNCYTECSTKCVQQSCNRVSGLCDFICDSKTNLSCPADCPNGFHGENCTVKCSSTCKDMACNNLGYCITCLPGYEGHYCEIEQKTNTLSLEAGIGIGIAIGVVVMVMIFVFILIVYKFRNKSSTSRSKRNNESSHGTQLQPYDGVKQINEYDRSYETTGPHCELKQKTVSDIDEIHVTSQYENTSSSDYEQLG